MIYLIGSIVLSSYLTLAFKACQRLGISVFQAIVFNYITCVITGSFVNGAFPVTARATGYSWFWWACIMGVMFISLFNLIGVTAQRNGVAVASVANKLSLIIPVVLSVYLYNETVMGWKIVGIGLALVAVVLTCYQAKDKTSAGSGNSYLFPLLLFIGSGLLDALINHVQQKHVTEETSNAFLITGFSSAAAIGTITLATLYIRRQQQFEWKNLVAGVLIGIPNYFSIWCLVKFLKSSPLQSSQSIPVNNMGIVLFSSVAAWLLFREKLSVINWAGIILSLAAIALIAFG